MNWVRERCAGFNSCCGSPKSILTLFFLSLCIYFLETAQNKLNEQLEKATISNCDDLANQKRKVDEQIVVIEGELKLREKHFETAVKEQHKRRHDALQAKLKARKDAKVQ